MVRKEVKTFRELKKIYAESLKLKEIKPMLELKNSTDSMLSLKKIQHVWEPLPETTRKCYRALETDKIYILSRENDAKNPKMHAIYLTVYIGAEIMDLLQLKIRDRVHLLTDKNNPNYLRIAKTTAFDGYVIGKASKTSTCHVSFRYNGILMLKTTKTTEVDFDLFNDSSFMIDISKIKAKGSLYGTK